ncbi:hypothetical protein RHMOL_Rhmol11G0067100 [Rhododendron molle]|uniref:Uncharacterized protein n=1 Tax=Rhododendron molle TaxID=49168 RepID=A0ACC0LPH9_RHOML|nr:hypothetical protein RHMOL_Rhmol11G0067100 [Rhododendron molle]
MAVYNGTPLAKTFLKYINVIPSTPKNIAPEGSGTFSDDGFGDIEPSDGEKEVEQPMPVAAIPLQVVPPPNTFRRKKHTRTLVPIIEEPSNTLSSPKRRKAFIADSNEDNVSNAVTGWVTRCRQAIREQEKAKEEKEKGKQEAELDEHAKLSNCSRKRPSHRSSSTQTLDISSSHQNPSQEVPTVEPIIEENPDTMVDLNQVRNPEGVPEPSTVEASNVGNPVDFAPAISETPLPEELDKSVHASTEISPPLVGTLSPETDEPPILEEIPPLEIHSSKATANMVMEETMPSKTPIVLNPMDELVVLLDPPSSCLKSTFFNEEVQELIEIHQGFDTLDFSSLIEHQLWELFEICYQALALLKPNSSDLTHQIQHGISNIRSDFPYIQDLFQERKALRVVEEDMENLHS